VRARGENWHAIDQDHVAADAELGVFARNGDGLIRRSGAGHERGARENTCGMEFADGAIDTGGQAKIVGVDDETLHRLSLSIQDAGHDARRAGGREL